MSKYIDKDELWERLKTRMVHHIVTNTLFNTKKAVIDDMPTNEIVHCKDCKHYIVSIKGCGRNPCIEAWYETDFCNYGERREK